MQIITTSALVTALCVLVTGCTATNSSNPQSAATTPSPMDYLTADQIRKTIVGNTIEGIAYYSSVGNVPFKMYFEPGTRVYRDRSVVRKNVKTAFGTYRVKDEGLICRTSRSRRKGVETCFRISNTNGIHRLKETISRRRSTEIRILPGKAL